MTPSDPRFTSETFKKARVSEIEGLRSPGTWEVVKKDTLPDNANLLGGGFVLAPRNAGI